jgi:C4-dicarboxylate-specific signal transduction histidine kinase
MEKNENIHNLTEGGFRFFGKMSASATHEIKNTLAIINENIGLMEDLSMMAPDGMLSCEQINSVAKNIKTQIQRSNNIIQRLNQFSHSVDLSEQVVDYEKTVQLTVDIASRLIDMHEVTVKITPASSPVSIKVNQFFLENMIWKAVEAACHGAQLTKNVTISFENDIETLSIWFSMGEITDDFMDNLFLTDEDKALIEYLDITIEKNKSDNSFGLVWSAKN